QGASRRPPRGSTGATSEFRAVDADVLDDAHVDDAHAAVGAARVVDVAQRVDDGVAVGRAGLVHGGPPGRGGSFAMRNPVVGVARPGSAASTREARTPQAWSRYEQPHTERQPSSYAGS